MKRSSLFSLKLNPTEETKENKSEDQNNVDFARRYLTSDEEMLQP